MELVVRNVEMESLGDINKKVYEALISYKIYPFPFGYKRNDDYLINEKKIF